MPRAGLVVAVFAACAAQAASSSPTLSTYFANWAIYHAAPYSYTAADLAGISDKLEEVSGC
jgi:hypothetical protein